MNKYKNTECRAVSINARHIESVRQYYVDKSYNELTVTDVYIQDNVCWCTCKCVCGKECAFRLTNVVRGRNKSCGCAISKEVMSARQKKWCKNNPEKVREHAEKYSKWCKDNPDKVKEKSNKVSLFYKNHPEVAAENGKKVSQWYKDNPEKVKEKAENFSKWCKDNHEIVIDKISAAVRNLHKRNRIKAITKEMIDVIHPDDIASLVNGDLHAISCWVRSKCPMCGKYDYHLYQT